MTLSGYAVIKLVGQVPHAIIALTLITLMVDLSCSNISLPVMSSFSEMSQEILRSLKTKRWSSYVERHLRGWRPLRIYAGPFFYVKKETRTGFFGTMLYYTMSLVISV